LQTFKNNTSTSGIGTADPLGDWKDLESAAKGQMPTKVVTFDKKIRIHLLIDLSILV